MKLRLIISAAVIGLIILFLPYVLLAFESFGQGVFALVMVFSFVIVGYYVFGGLAKLMVYSIYFIALLLGLFFLDEAYQVTVSLISTFIILTNPLQRLEKKLAKKISKEFNDPIKINISGTYWPYFEYRREMKELYHLPQSKKLHQNKSYLLLRQFVTVLFLFAATFLLIQETSSIANDLSQFEWSAFFNIYIVLWFYLMSYYAYKKALTTVFRVLVLGMIPMMMYALSLSSISGYFKLITLIVVGVISVGIIIYEWNQYYQRVSFDTYSYTDSERGLEVFANALFEPLIYNDTYILSATYRIKISLNTWNKHLQKIVVYANMHRILITAYAYGEEMLYVFTDFHYQDRRKIDRFKTFLESIFMMGIPFEFQQDRHKTIYEKNFFHKDEYIIARAKHLARYLKDISNETLVIISFIMYIETKKDLDNIKKTRQVTLLSDIHVTDYYAIKIDVPVVNNDIIIEKAVKQLLFDMKANKGNFVRILVSKIHV